MKMHEHVTCKDNCIMGSAQSKPISTQSVAHITHTSKCMKYSYDAHGMQCMQVLRLNLQNLSQKFCKHLFDFDKP